MFIIMQIICYYCSSILFDSVCIFCFYSVWKQNNIKFIISRLVNVLPSRDIAPRSDLFVFIIFLDVGLLIKSLNRHEDPNASFIWVLGVGMSIITVNIRFALGTVCTLKLFISIPKSSKYTYYLSFCIIKLPI